MNSSTQPFVSIVMCVYNGEDYLEEQIDSILNQTHSNFELLILDDRSTDDSKDIIQRFLRKDSRIRYYENDTNLGFNKNFEKGFSLSTGDLIAVSDQDDIWNENKIEKLVCNIGDHLLIYSNSTLIDESGRLLNRTLDCDVKHVDKPSYKSFLDGNFITGHTCLFKKGLFTYAFPFPRKISYYDWWLGFTASYVGEVKYLNETLTQYRIHTTSVIQEIEGAKGKQDIKSRDKYLQLESFAKADFLQSQDRKFIEKFVKRKSEANKGTLAFLTCYGFILQHHKALYPWYNKSMVKKLNFLRKQCK